MATLYIDNKAYEVKDGQNLLQACLSLGFDLPYFCWHPALHAVGACRQCAVKQFKDENDTRGKIIMSCMAPATDGTRISIDDPEAKAFRAGIIELLMVNHPHDCPVCDEGGECHLQDMTVMTGHNYRRYRFPKRTHRNQQLGPFINHEMNRCIQCYRCVRFYRDYAGGRDFNVFGSHHHVYFGRYEDGALENGFSGNLVEICPTGVFTDKTLKRHYTRKWDLQTAPSVCVHCGLGCNTLPGERYGILRRILNRYNSEVNSYFLCDRGRFGYEFVNSEKRIRKPFLRISGSGGPASGGTVSREDIMNHLKHLLSFGSKVIGIGSPRASLESNFALRTLVGQDNFYPGVSRTESELISSVIDILRNGPARSASLNDVRRADAVFILGEDVTNSAPMLDLSLRQSVLQRPLEKAREMKIPEWQAAAVQEAAQEEKSPLFIASPCSTKLDAIATGTYHAVPDDIASLGYAVAHEIDGALPFVEGLPDETAFLARSIANALKAARSPVIVSGLSCGSRPVVEAAADIARALCKEQAKAGICYVVPECNSIGLGILSEGCIDDAIEKRRSDRAETVVILENDISRRIDAESASGFLKSFEHIIVIDHLINDTTQSADILVPAATFGEASGTLVNNEGRAQRFFSVFRPDDEIREGWKWLGEMMSVADHPEADKFRGLDSITAAMSELIPAEFQASNGKIPRQPHRYSGRTAMNAGMSVHEPKPAADSDSPYTFSMEGYSRRVVPRLLPRYWSPGWNSVQALNKYQKEIGGQLCGGDPGARLFGRMESRKADYFSNIPEKFAIREDELLILPMYHIFGSEELSSISPGIAELIPEPYIAINRRTADKYGVSEGEELAVSIKGLSVRLKTKIEPSLPHGAAGLPVGIDGLKGVVLPAWGKVWR